MKVSQQVAELELQVDRLWHAVTAADGLRAQQRKYIEAGGGHAEWQSLIQAATEYDQKRARVP